MTTMMSVVGERSTFDEDARCWMSIARFRIAVFLLFFVALRAGATWPGAVGIKQASKQSSNEFSVQYTALPEMDKRSDYRRHGSLKLQMQLFPVSVEVAASHIHR